MSACSEKSVQTSKKTQVNVKEVFLEKDIKEAEEIGKGFLQTVIEQKTYTIKESDMIQKHLEAENQDRLFHGDKMIPTSVKLPVTSTGDIICTQRVADNICTVQMDINELKIINVKEKKYKSIGIHSLEITYSQPRPDKEGEDMNFYLEFVKRKDGKISIYEGSLLSNVYLEKYDEDAQTDPNRKAKIREEIESAGLL